MTDKLEMPIEMFAEAVAKENARLTEENEQLRKDIRLAIMSDTEYNTVIEKENEQLRQTLEMGTIPEQNQRMFELIAEIERLTKKCDMQAMILRRLTPENHPDTIFIHGTLGEKDDNGMPEKLLVVPAYGVDFSYIYEYTGKTTGNEW